MTFTIIYRDLTRFALTLMHTSYDSIE